MSEIIVKNNETRKKLILLICLYSVFISVRSQENLNSSKNWGIELKGSKHYVVTSVESDLLYRSNKNCYFAGFGIRLNSDYQTNRPVLKAGYRRYPGKGLRKLEFYYQTFLYYSTNRYERLAYEKFLTLNYGIGIEYLFLKRLSAGISTNFGYGYEFEMKSQIFTFFPVQFKLGYKF